MSMTKPELVQQIITQLSRDLEVFLAGARTAHEAATHAENQPDNEYDTLALEASYVAQGQANRAQEIRQAIETYKQLPVAAENDVVRLTSLVTIEAEDGTRKTLFIGPVAGGVKITDQQTDIMVITPASPLGRELLGKSAGDSVEIMTGTTCTEYELVAVR
jgi:transcription elongation GreA/GreB family factor